MQISDFKIFLGKLSNIGDGKKLITTLNAHSFNISKTDSFFLEALKKSDVLIPDGISVVWAIKWLTGKSIKKIAGADLFNYEMDRLQADHGRCFFLGSSEETLSKIEERLKTDYPNVVVGSFSPPYTEQFTEDESNKMIDVVNEFNPDVLFIGMTAPKQEKWAYKYFERLETGHICCIGAVFDFYAGNIHRAPDWMINLGLEWLYRLGKEPKRMWRRYVLGNIKFIYFIFCEKYLET